MEKVDTELPTKQPVRYTTHTNVWDTEGLRKARTDRDGDEVLCTATKTPLFYIREDGTKIMLESFGDCTNCGHIFHTSYLAFSEGHARAHWPIEYKGQWCRDCVQLDPSDWENPPEDWPNVFRGL